MKLLASLVFLAVSTASRGTSAAFCTTDQLAVASSLTSDGGLLLACPSMVNADILAGVAPCALPSCVSFLSTLSGRLPDCDVDEGKTFKDLYAAFVSVCQDNAAAVASQPTANATLRANVTTTAPPTNGTTNGTATAAPGVNATNATTPVPMTVLPSLNQTTSNSTVGGNATTGSNATAGSTDKASDSDAVGANVTPAVPAPAPKSLGVRPTLMGVGAVVVTAVAMALVA